MKSNNFKEEGSFYPVQNEKPLLERGVIKDSINPKTRTIGLVDIKKPSEKGKQKQLIKNIVVSKN